MEIQGTPHKSIKEAIEWLNAVGDGDCVIQIGDVYLTVTRAEVTRLLALKAPLMYLYDELSGYSSPC